MKIVGLITMLQLYVCLNNFWWVISSPQTTNLIWAIVSFNNVHVSLKFERRSVKLQSFQSYCYGPLIFLYIMYERLNETYFVTNYIAKNWIFPFNMIGNIHPQHRHIPSPVQSKTGCRHHRAAERNLISCGFLQRARENARLPDTLIQNNQ